MNLLIPALVEGLIDAMINSQGGTPAPGTPPSPIATPAGLVRTIPANAEKATMNPPYQGMVQMDDKALRLSPASQIRDEFNRIVLPGMLQKPVLVRYTTDSYGNVHNVWILTQAEARQPVPKPQ
ncbi:MAG: hypothetical protein ACOZCP_02740 [Pseudomonadota bacterium]|jgi:hypothetical protein